MHTVVCLPISLPLFLLTGLLFSHPIPLPCLADSVFIDTSTQVNKMRRNVYHLASVVWQTIPHLLASNSYHLLTSWLSELVIWASLSWWFFCSQPGSVMCLRSTAWLLGTSWSRTVSKQRVLSALCVSRHSAQAQVVHIKSAQVFKRGSIKGLMGPQLTRVHCHFHCIWLTKARHKASPDLMHWKVEPISLHGSNSKSHCKGHGHRAEKVYFCAFLYVWCFSKGCQILLILFDWVLNIFILPLLFLNFVCDRLKLEAVWSFWVLILSFVRLNNSYI